MWDKITLLLSAGNLVSTDTKALLLPLAVVAMLVSDSQRGVEEVDVSQLVQYLFGLWGIHKVQASYARPS